MEKKNENKFLDSLRRSSVVGFAMFCDILFNYPLWITAKRIGANLSPFPKDIRMIYQGGGTLWFSLGPTTIIEDFMTRFLHSQSAIFSSSSSSSSSSSLIHMLCAATSGLIAALTITSQVEHLITLSHVQNQPILQTARRVYQQQPLKLILPPGMIAMIGREVPFSTALFYFRPLIAQYFESSNNSHSHSHSQKIWYQQFFSDLQYGFLTSLVATPLSHPASVIASYQQGHGKPLLVSIQDISQRYGWKGFFNGLTARTVSLTGTFTVVPIVLRVFSSLKSDEEE